MPEIVSGDVLAVIGEFQACSALACSTFGLELAGEFLLTLLCVGIAAVMSSAVGVPFRDSRVP